MSWRYTSATLPVVAVAAVAALLCCGCGEVTTSLGGGGKGGGGAGGGAGGAEEPCNGYCPSGWVCCDSVCVLAASAPVHCGGPEPPATCEDGWLDCDGIDGCETMGSSDPLNCGGCGFECDATCAEGACQVLHEAELLHECGLNAFAVAVDSEHVFAAECGSPQAVVRFEKDGGNPTALAGKQNGVIAMVLDASAVYFANYGAVNFFDGDVRRVSKSGGDEQVLVEVAPEPAALALDDTYVYYTDVDLQAVMRVPKQGGEVVVLATDDAGVPGDIAVDDEHVFWTDWVTGRVLRTDKTATSSTPSVLAEGLDIPDTLAIATSRLFVATFNVAAFDGTIWAIPKTGGPLEIIATGQPFWISEMAVDGAHLYFMGGGSVRKVPLAGGLVTVLASQYAQSEGMAVDATHVFWGATFWDGPPHHPAIWRVPK